MQAAPSLVCFRTNYDAQYGSGDGESKKKKFRGCFTIKICETLFFSPTPSHAVAQKINFPPKIYAMNVGKHVDSSDLHLRQKPSYEAEDV